MDLKVTHLESVIYREISVCYVNQIATFQTRRVMAATDAPVSLSLIIIPNYAWLLENVISLTAIINGTEQTAN